MYVRWAEVQFSNFGDCDVWRISAPNHTQAIAKMIQLNFK